ncbi:hypothetical protein [Tabrizicola sp. XJSP]|uniref:hypothetical protein n=1 Tax=Pseudotabrizicola formosa TaxID=2030009 RepID=UPI0011AF699C
MKRFIQSNKNGNNPFFFATAQKLSASHDAASRIRADWVCNPEDGDDRRDLPQGAPQGDAPAAEKGGRGDQKGRSTKGGTHTNCTPSPTPMVARSGSS